MNLIFDFDGTIADTFPIYLKVMRDIHQEYNFRYIEEQNIELYRGMTAQEVLKYLGISKVHVPIVAKRVKADFSKLITHQTIFPHWASTFSELKNLGHSLFILSSNSENNIRSFLEKNRANHFDKIISYSSIFGKARVIKKMLKALSLCSEDTFYLGDETRDIEASKKIGIQIISVSWGYNNREALEKMRPNFLIDHPNELFEILGKNSD